MKLNDVNIQITEKFNEYSRVSAFQPGDMGEVAEKEIQMVELMDQIQELILEKSRLINE